MPIEIRRFGVGHRRPDGPPGSTGVTGQPVHTDARGVIAELAFARGAAIEPHANPNTTWLVVIEGGGWVGVGEEYTRIAAGEAVLWPADIPHAAWTEHSQMRAFLVEFIGSDGAIVGTAATAHTDADLPIGRGVGQLARRTAPAPGNDPEAGEPS